MLTYLDSPSALRPRYRRPLDPKLEQRPRDSTSSELFGTIVGISDDIAVVRFEVNVIDRRIACIEAGDRQPGSTTLTPPISQLLNISSTGPDQTPSACPCQRGVRTRRC